MEVWKCMEKTSIFQYKNSKFRLMFNQCIRYNEKTD